VASHAPVAVLLLPLAAFVEMKPPSRIAGALALFLLSSGFLSAAPVIPAQTGSQLLTTTEPTARVSSVRGISAFDGAAIEIISDHPIMPQIRQLDNPSRLVIDLPNAAILNNKTHSDFHSDDVAAIRASQFQKTPPSARVVVDLVRPVTFTWDAAGNRLMVRLRPVHETAKMAPSPSSPQTSLLAAVPLTSAAARTITLAGDRVLAGASVTAGSEISVLRLERGGEVKICPGTTISVTSSQNGRSLMLALGTGVMEAHYALDATADSILTPDFRILLAGPGEFDYGVSADSRGDTCIQALPGNTASVIVSELLGDGTYQVKPTEQVVFHSGHLRAVDRSVTGTCGCPASAPAVMLAAKPSATDPLPPSKANDVHVQVDAPFVFNAKDPLPPAPPPTNEAKLLSTTGVPRPIWNEAALPPPQAPHHGAFSKIRHFFAAIFG